MCVSVQPVKSACVCPCICPVHMQQCLIVLLCTFICVCFTVYSMCAQYCLVVQFCFLYNICRVTSAYTICMFVLQRVNMYVCLCLCVLLSACVYWMRLASDPNGPALGKKKTGVREAMIKTSGSTPLKLMTVCLSDWIYLSQMPGKLASKWLWWQSPWISQMADTQNVYVHRTRGGSIKGQWCEKEQGKKEKKSEGVRWSSIVR